MNVLRRLITIFACGFALGVERAAAQERITTAVDATVGGGFGNGGEFYDRSLQGARLAVSVRRSDPTRFGFFGELAIDALSITSSHVAVCYPSPRGGCLASYPDLLGPTLTGGLIVQRADRIEARLGVGGGAFVGDGVRLGAVVSQADVAVFPVTHIGVIAGTRWVVLPRYRGDHLTIVPWAIGIRIR